MTLVSFSAYAVYVEKCFEYKDHNQADFYTFSYDIQGYPSIHTHIIYSTLYFLRLPIRFHSLPLLPFHRFVCMPFFMTWITSGMRYILFS